MAAAARLVPRLALRFLALDPRELGLVGEGLAARAYAAAGGRTRARRLATVAAEVDLLVELGGELLCVEVKTGRAGPRFTPGQRVDARRRERLLQAARIIAQRSGKAAHAELCEVLLDRRGRLAGIQRRGLEGRETTFRASSLMQPHGPWPMR